jgi:SAM-dependent methyltransferase
MLPGRGSEGYAVYAAGMEASAGDKARLLAFVRPGRIADLGCGSGAVLELLRRAFPDSRLVGVDASAKMIALCRERFPEGVDFLRRDITKPIFAPASVDTIVLCSILHEVFTYKGYDYDAVRRTLRHAAKALRPGGRILLRDGVKPATEESVYLRFLRDGVREKFRRFAREFGSSEVAWKEVDGRTRVARRDAMEFLTKYIYEKNWRFEVKEHFGVYTLAEWARELQAAGFRVLRAESYLIEWLRVTHWEKDVALETRAGERAEWPHSTMLVAAERV